MIRGIHHVAINCRDMDRMVKFYDAAFGFKPVDEGFNWKDDETIAKIIGIPKSTAKGQMLRAGSCYIELFQYEAPDPKAETPLVPYDKGYTHFCVDVTDIENEYVRLKKVGMTFPHPEPIDAGHVKTIYGKDPEGNLIEIQQTADNCVFRLDKLPPVAK